MARQNRGMRPARVASLIRQAIAEVLRTEVKDPRVAAANLSDVEVTGDLREAKVFVHGPTDEEERQQLLAGLERCAGFVRHQVGQRVALRHTPQIRFMFDDSIAYGARIDAALKGLNLGEEEE